MNDKEIVKEFHHAIEQGDLEQVRDLLDDEFVFDHGTMEGNMGRGMYLDAVAALQRGIPDLRFNLSDLQGEGTVTGTAQLTGTHTDTLDLSVIDGPQVEATGITFEGPEEPAKWQIRNGKVAHHSVDAVPGGGIGGILEQLGVESEMTH